jgi:hypothetical protein
MIRSLLVAALALAIMAAERIPWRTCVGADNISGPWWGVGVAALGVLLSALTRTRGRRDRRPGAGRPRLFQRVPGSARASSGQLPANLRHTGVTKIATPAATSDAAALTENAAVNADSAGTSESPIVWAVRIAAPA